MEEDTQKANPTSALGSAAVTMYGEGSKLDKEDLEIELDLYRDQQAPVLGR